MWERTGKVRSCEYRINKIRRRCEWNQEEKGSRATAGRGKGGNGRRKQGDEVT